MDKYVIPYRSLAHIINSDFIVPLYLTDSKEYSLCNCINGYADNGIGCDILFIDNNLDMNKPYISMINRYGFIKAVYGDKVVKRHIVDISDIKGIFMTEDLQDIVYLDELGIRIIKHRFTRIDSECFVIRTYDELSNVGFIDRNGNFTFDITKAWFTFDKSQALSYSGRLLLKDMKIYEAVSVNDVIDLDIYEME